MKRLLLRFLIAGVLALPAAGRPAFGDGDRQVWSLIQVQKALFPRWTVLAAEELRWGENASEFYFHRPEIGVGVRVSPLLSFLFSYKHIHSRESGRWRRARIPNASVILDFNRMGLAVMNRNRVEYVDSEAALDFWRYRGLASVRFPWRLPGLKSRPYVSDEAFFHLGGSGLKINRVYAGLGTGVGRTVKLDTYFMLHQIRSEKGWTCDHVFGTILTFVF